MHNITVCDIGTPYYSKVDYNGHRPKSKQISSMAAQTASSSDILATQALFDEVSSTGKQRSLVGSISFLKTHLTYNYHCSVLWYVELPQLHVVVCGTTACVNNVLEAASHFKGA